MATQVLSLGVPTAVTQNVVYALPAKRALLFTASTAATIQQANDVAFATAAALTLASGQAEVAGAYIRCTSGNIIVTIKGA